MCAVDQVREGRRLWAQVRRRYWEWDLPETLTQAELIRLGEEPNEINLEFGVTYEADCVLVCLTTTDVPLYIGESLDSPRRATVWSGIYPHLGDDGGCEFSKYTVAQMMQVPQEGAIARQVRETLRGGKHVGVDEDVPRQVR